MRRKKEKKKKRKNGMECMRKYEYYKEEGGKGVTRFDRRPAGCVF